MAFDKLDRDEQNIVLECMTAILKGPYIEDPEFRTRLGIDRAELNEVISAYPNLDDDFDESIASLAINNCLNEVINGLSIPRSEWNKWFSKTKEGVQKTYVKWAKLKGRPQQRGT